MIGVPKPQKSTDREKLIDRLAKVRARQAKWRAIAMQRAKGKARKPISTKAGPTKVRRLKEYAAHLRSPFWKALRKVVFERDGYRCVDCGAEAGYFVSGKRDMRGLECDHITYRNWMKETPADCATRCRPCHRKKHAGGWHKRFFGGK